MNGPDILDRLRAALCRYVVLPSPEAADAVTLWVAASHVQPAWAHAPRLVIRGPEKRCGKSRLLDIVEATCHRPLITVNASTAAVYRSIGTDEPPTLLIDEADSIFGPKAGDANEDLRGLLNAGHQRNRPALRWDPSRSRLETIATFAMAALAGIGTMPDTIEDRAVIIRMRRRAPHETVAPYRHKRDRPALHTIAEDLTGWLRPHHDQLQDAEPAMPVEDRAADTWEPLVTVADLAGAHWPDRARHAVIILTADAEQAAAVSTRVQLLTDCRAAFSADEALPTAVLLDRLKADPEAPWTAYGPAGLTAMRLGVMLRDYDIRSTTIRFPTGQAKGYQRSDFADAWTRYCPAETDRAGKPYQPYQPSQPRSERYGLPDRYGLSRTTTPSRTGLTSEKEAGTAGTATPQPTCIHCRQPLAYDDGTRTHPTCTGGAA
jgi:hypothetical protein